MKESVAIAKEADTKKEFSPTKSDNSIHRVRDEPERQFGYLRSVIDNIRHDGGTPSVESIATELSSMPAAQRALAMLALQRTHGNQYVQRVVTGIQAKLKVGQPNDRYEQEADRVADAVMRIPEPQVQRQGEKDEKKLIQTKTIADQITPLVQRQVEEEEEEIPRSLKVGGQPLSESARAFFEPRFGYGFSQVRIHTDTRAAESAQAVNARAYTVGRDIAFGPGQYSPGTTEGRRLLAHELTHVVQQAQSLRAAKIGVLQRTVERRTTCHFMSCPDSSVVYVEIRLGDGTVNTLSHAYPIDPSGYLKLPSLGRVAARGRRLDQIGQDILQASSRYIVNPTVNVSPLPVTVPYCQEVRPNDTLYVRILNNVGRVEVSGSYQVDPQGRLNNIPRIGNVDTNGESLFCVEERLEAALRLAIHPTTDYIYPTTVHVSTTPLRP